LRHVSIDDTHDAFEPTMGGDAEPIMGGSSFGGGSFGGGGGGS